MADTVLEKAIDEAAAQLVKEAGGEQKEEKEESSEVVLEKEEGEEQEEQEQTQEEELSAEELQQAKNLAAALKDPKAGPAVIAALAQQMGILNRPIETKKEEVKAVKSIKDILSESLGEDYKFLADKLAPAIEQVVARERESQNQTLRVLEEKDILREVDAVNEKLARETKGESKKFEAKMAELANELLPAPGQSIEKYLRNLYAIASQGKQTSTPSKQIADKIRRNANDVPGRIVGGANRSIDSNAVPDKKMNLDQSVEWAMKMLSKGK